MFLLLEEVSNKALDLPREEQAELAHELIVSLDDVVDRKVEASWDAEI